MEKRACVELGSFERLAQIVRVGHNALFNFRNWCNEEGLELIAGFENDEVALAPFTPEAPRKTVDEIMADISKLEEFITLLKDVHTGDEIRAIETRHGKGRQQTAEAIGRNVQVEAESVARAKAVVSESYRARELELRTKYEEEVSKIKAEYAPTTVATTTTMSTVYEEKQNE